MRQEFADLINPKTGCFKWEVSRSLKTSDPDEAKKRGRKENVKIAARIEDAVTALDLAGHQKRQWMPMRSLPRS